MSGRQLFMLSFRSALIVFLVVVALVGRDQPLGQVAALQGLATFVPAALALTVTILVFEPRPVLRPWVGISWAVIFALVVLGLVATSGEQVDPATLGYSFLGVLLATSRDRVAGTLNGVMAAGSFTYLAWAQQLAAPLSVYVLSVDAVFLAAGVFTGFLSRESEQEREEAAVKAAALQRELADVGQHLGDVLSCVASGVLVVDADRRVSTYNRAAERILGVPAHQVLGRPVGVVPRLRQLEEALTGPLSEDPGSGTGELHPRRDLAFRRPDGRQVRIGYSLTPLENVAARRLGSILVFQDVTLIRDYEARLLGQEKLAALGRLVSGIAHEFGNLLGGARGHVDLALTGEPADAQEALPIVRDTLSRALETIEHLLRFARGTPLNCVPGVRPQAVLEDALQLMRVELDRRGVQVERRWESASTITADAGQLQQVFVNLIINASHALEGVAEPRLRIDLSEAEGRVRIAFEDSGPGVPPELRSKVFEPFFTTKGALGGSEVPGTGLGLATCLGVVEGHEGTLTVEESDLGGASFAVSLPAEAPSTNGEGSDPA